MMSQSSLLQLCLRNNGSKVCTLTQVLLMRIDDELRQTL